MEREKENSSAVERVRLRESANGDALHRLGFVGLDGVFLDLLDHPAAFPLVVETLGWNVYLYHCHLDVHPPVRDPEPINRVFALKAVEQVLGRKLGRSAYEPTAPPAVRVRQIEKLLDELRP